MANLYDKAGLVNIPVGYQEGFLYNIKPTDNTLAFRFNRDSAATRVNKEGLIEQVGYFGPELVKNGNFNDNTNDWTQLGNSSISVGTYEGRSNVANINILNTSTSSRIQQDFNYVNGKKYKVSVDVYLVSGDFRLDCRDSFVSGDFVSTNTTGSWLTLSAEIEANATGTDVIWLRSSGTVSQFYVSNVSIKEVLGDKPRIDYTDSLTSPSFLLEPQSTNLVTYSEDFSQWTTQGTITTTPSYGISPDGTKNSTRIFFSDGSQQIYKNFTSSSGVSGSIYVKGNSGQAIKFGVTGGEEIFTLNGDWQRLTTYSSSSTRLTINTYGAASTARDIEVWGAQAEALSYTTSYIPTAGSTVTRAQETCNSAGSASTFNSTEGVLYAEIAALVNDGTIRRISLSDGGTSNRLEIFYGTIANRIDYNIYSNSSFQASGFSLLSNATDFNKIAVKYKENEFALWVNGTKASTDTSGNTPIGLNKLQLQAASGSNDFYGKTKGVYVFNQALTDDELQQLTT